MHTGDEWIHREVIVIRSLLGLAIAVRREVREVKQRTINSK
jgi:hypothetical protein